MESKRLGAANHKSGSRRTMGSILSGSADGRGFHLGQRPYQLLADSPGTTSLERVLYVT